MWYRRRPRERFANDYKNAKKRRRPSISFKSTRVRANDESRADDDVVYFAEYMMRSRTRNRFKPDLNYWKKKKKTIAHACNRQYYYVFKSGIVLLLPPLHLHFYTSNAYYLLLLLLYAKKVLDLGIITSFMCGAQCYIIVFNRLTAKYNTLACTS